MPRKSPARPRPTLDEIVATLRAHLPELRQRYGVASLGVFGSYVRGEQRQRSDVDVLVDIEDDTLTLFKFVELQEYVSDLLGVRVDLVEEKSLKPYVGRRILQEVIPV